MRKNFHLLFFVKVMVLGWINIFFLFGNVFSQSKLFREYDEAVYKDYFRLLETISSNSFPDQLSKLHAFLIRHPDFEYTYFKIYDLYRYQEKFSESETYFQKLSMQQPVFRQNSLWVLANINLDKGDVNAALKAYKAALSSGLPPFSLFYDIVRDYFKYAGKKELFEFYNLGISKKYDYLLKGLIHFFSRKYDKAVEILSLLPKDELQNSRIITIFARCYYLGKDIQKADSLYRIALKVAKRKGDLASEARILMNIGTLYGRMNNTEKKIYYYNLAFDTASKINDYYSMQLIAGNRGLYYKSKEKFSLAKRQFYKAYRIAAQIKNFRLATTWGSRYAQMLYFMRNFNDAISAYDESEQFAIKAKVNTLLVRIKIDKGDIYSYLQQNELAKLLFQEAYDIAKKSHLEQEAHIANVRLAKLLVKEAKYDEARQVYKDYIYFIEKNREKLKIRGEVAYLTWQYARTYMLEKKYIEARKYFLKTLKRAQEEKKMYYYQWAALDLAKISMNLGDIPAALRWYNKILLLVNSENKKRSGILSDIYLGMGDAYKKDHQFKQAISSYLQAASIIEKTRSGLKVQQFRIGYFSEEYKVYENLVNCYYQLYLAENKSAYLDSLFYYDQMAKSRGLHELRLQKKSGTEVAENDIFYINYLQACRNLEKRQRQLRVNPSIVRTATDLNDVLSKVEADKYSLIEQKLRLVSDDQTRVNNSKAFICTLDEALTNLKKTDTALLLYHISQNASFVFILSDNHIQVINLNCKLDSVQTLVDSLMNPLHHVQADSIKFVPFNAAVSYHLYKMLIQPVEQEIQLPNNLLIVADHTILNLPLELLLDNPPEKKVYYPTDYPNYSDKFIIHRYSISYAPSVSFLKRNPAPVTSKPKFLIFANPIGENEIQFQTKQTAPTAAGWNFSPLPYSEREAFQIKQIVKQAKIYRHNEASEARFRNQAPKMQIIHLATHGFVDLSFDAFSGLVLAVGEDSTDDGLLMGYEISDLNLNCDLVSLSACETGRGKTVKGEGVLGLPRLFLGSGTKTVLMTLWKVDDKFTSELMPLFYDYLINKKSSVPNALTNAKRELLKQQSKDVYYQHPFFWASFCLYGEHSLSIRPMWIPYPITVSVLVLFLFVILLFFKKIRKKNS